MRGRFTVGSADSWYWTFGLLILAPMVLSEVGLLQSIVIWLTETGPTYTVASIPPAGEPSKIAPPSIGNVPGTNTRLYVLIALLFMMTGRCAALLPKAPIVVAVSGAAICVWTLNRGESWIYPGAFLPIAVACLLLQRRRLNSSSTEELRALIVAFGLWLLCFSYPYIGLTVVGIGAFGVVKPQRADWVGSTILALAALITATLTEGAGASSTGRYAIYGVAVIGVMVQFGRSGRLSSSATPFSFLVLAFASLHVWSEEIFGSYANALGWKAQGPLALESINWVELLAAFALLAIARWIGVIVYQNKSLIETLKKDVEAPKYFNSALKASAPMLGLAGVLWVGWFIGSSYVERVLIDAYVTNARELKGACPGRVGYGYEPSPVDLLATLRLEIERDRLEMRRCFAYRVDQGVDSSQKSVNEVAAAAKSSFNDLWPDRLPGTETESCGWLDVICLLKNGVKSLVNRRYQKLKSEAVSRFEASTDEEAKRLNAVGGATGESMKAATLANVDDWAREEDELAIEASRKSTIIELAITLWMLFQACKLYLSVLARFVLSVDDYRCRVQVDECEGPVVFSLLKDGKDGRKIDVDGWQFASRIAIANCKMHIRRPYQPRFAVLRRLSRWYVTYAASPLEKTSDPPCLVESSPDVFVKVKLPCSSSAVSFDPEDLIGFKEGVRFKGEWNFRLISLVFYQHRRWVAHGPGSLLLRFPNGATVKESASVVNTVRAHKARHLYGVAGSCKWWDVALTPETIVFPRASTTWITPKKKWRAKLKMLRSFLLPV